MEQNYKRILVIGGATGGIGYHVIKNLVETTDYFVTIISRNFEKDQQILNEHIKFVEHYTFNLNLECKENKDKILVGDYRGNLHRIFEEGKFDYVINTISYRLFSNDDPYILEFLLPKLLADLCKQFNCQLVMISIASITNFYSYSLRLVNLIGNKMIYYKFQAETYIRKSEIKHVIFRISNLFGNKETQAHNYVLQTANKQSEGQISRSTVAQLIIDLIGTKNNFNDQLIFQVSSNKKLQSEPYIFHYQSFQLLNTDLDFVENRHYNVLKSDRCKLTVLLSFSFVIYFVNLRYK